MNILPMVEERQIKQVNKSEIVLSLENLIKTHISSISKLTEEKKKKNDMYRDAFEGSVVYREHAEKAKEASKILKTTKAEITKQPQLVKLHDEVKTLSSDIKDKSLALSDYLLEYQRLTGATQLELFDGEFVEIVNSATVKKGVIRGKK